MGKGHMKRQFVISPRHLNKPEVCVGLLRREDTYYNMKEYDKSWEDIKRAQELGGKFLLNFLMICVGSGKQEQIESKDPIL